MASGGRRGPHRRSRTALPGRAHRLVRPSAGQAAPDMTFGLPALASPSSSRPTSREKPSISPPVAVRADGRIVAEGPTRDPRRATVSSAASGWIDPSHNAQAPMSLNLALIAGSEPDILRPSDGTRRDDPRRPDPACLLGRARGLGERGTGTVVLVGKLLSRPGDSDQDRSREYRSASKGPVSLTTGRLGEVNRE